MDLFDLFSTLTRVLLVVFALGMVIFVHELGHFLVARWCGVLVQRFSIGFGKVIFSFKQGETEYAISAIPLGGYVKMLGQTDTPEIEEVVDDERSYQNKGVFARMAIISAGVIMNLIFGFICFAVAFGLGVEYLPAEVGVAMPAKPAWKAGVRAGDDITEINGHTGTDYEMLLNEVALTNPDGELVNLEVLRGDKKLDFTIKPEQDNIKPIIGVLPSFGLLLHRLQPTFPNSAAHGVWPKTLAATKENNIKDRVVKVNGQPVNSYAEYENAVYAGRGKPTTVTIRSEEKGAGDKVEAALTDVTVPPSYIRTVGLQMLMGEIVAIQADSPALNAKRPDGTPDKLEEKDIIKAVDGEENFDPTELPELLASKAGKEVELTILRQGSLQREIKLIVTPRDLRPWLDNLSPLIVSLNDSPMSVPALGIAYKILPTVRSLTPDSPAASGENPIQPRDEIKKVIFTLKADQGKEIQVDQKVGDDSWPSIFWAMQSPAVTKVMFQIERRPSGKLINVELVPQLDESRPFGELGLVFGEDLKLRVAENLGDAFSLGVKQTRSSVIRLYLFLRGLITRTISPTLLAGPLTIGKVAYQHSDKLPQLILFIGLLSINLAIINFLPIPVLDGGHMVFLLWEMVTRRQPNVYVREYATWFGLALIVCLMLFVFGMDIWRLIPS